MAMNELATDHASRSQRYVVIVRTHFCAARQFQWLRQRVRGGHIFVVVLNPTCLFDRKLRGRLPVALYLQKLASTFATKAQRTFRNQGLACQ